MVSEAHVLSILRNLEKYWTLEQYLDFTINAKDGSIQCHQILFSSLCKLSQKPGTTATSFKNSLNKETCLNNVAYFLSMLYKPTIKPQDFNETFISAAKMFGLPIPHLSKGSRKQSCLHEEFVKQRNLTFGNTLANSRINESLSDIFLLVQKQRFCCHKVILATFSAYFDAMFSSELSELHQEEVTIHDVDKKTFSKILDFMYTGEIAVTIQNVQDLMSTSSYLQIPLLQAQCERFMVRHIEIDNCIDVVQLGDTVGSDYLVCKGISFVCRHFSSVSKNKEFLTLTKSMINRILQNDQINAENEYAILKFVLLWIKQQKDKVEITDLMKNVRLSLVLESALEETLENPIVKKDKNCIQYINDVIQNKISKEERTRTFETEDVMVVMWSSSYIPGLHLACFSFVNNYWYQLPGLPTHSAGGSYGACSNDSDIYICGGSGNPTAFHRFNFTSNKWQKLGPIEFKYGRADHAMVIKNDDLYMLGGSQDRIVVWPYVDKYNITDKSWNRIGSLSIAVSNPSCAIFNESIIVFGGNKSFGEFVSAIQMYDLTTNSCTSFSKLPIMCSFSGLVMNEDVAYIVGPKGDVVLYEHGKDPVVLGSVHKQTMFGFGTAFYNGKVFVIGGSSDRMESTEARAFDVVSKTSSMTNRNMKVPAKKESNQYFMISHNIRKSLLIPENLYKD
ncbi:kelch-like protein 24 [Mytilus trossulus]|uniref:kelch-like protein 24 n=1 Tax=Mytilus trossulus TaxID=6551 RepID=UPI00300456AD